MLADITVTEESRLIALAQQGDRGAFGDLVCRYRSGVVNVVYRMCGDPCLAEDAAQVAFIRAWQNLPKFQPTPPLSGAGCTASPSTPHWICCVGRNRPWILTICRWSRRLKRWKPMWSSRNAPGK